MTDLYQKLTVSYRLGEFCRSEAAARAGIDIIPTQDEIDNLRALCAGVLQPMRDALQRPIRVNSGLRPAQVNNLVGGSPGSAHLTGRAADIEVHGMANLALAKFIRERHEAGQFPKLDKTILEFPSRTDDQAGWVHVQIAKLGAIPRGQFLTQMRIGKKVSFIEGLTI